MHNPAIHVGLLKNTDNGAPIIPIDEQDLTPTKNARQPPQHSSSRSNGSSSSNGNGSSGSSGSEQGALDSCDGVSIRWSGSNVKQAPVYQGGSYMDVHKKLGVASGGWVDRSSWSPSAVQAPTVWCAIIRQDQLL